MVATILDQAVRPLAEPPSRRGWSRLLTVAVLLIPVAAYFWLIHHFALNVVFYDQFSDVRVIAHPTLGGLWAQHSDHRIFFPNLVVLLLAHTTHLNIVAEEYLSASMLVASTVLIGLAHHRRALETPWFAYIPLVLLLFSFVQDGNTLWGFQLAWYMVLLSLAGCIYLLDRPNLIGPVFAAAVIIAVVGSFSSLQGLLIWPVGVLLNFQRRRSRALQFSWISSAVVTTAIYFYNFSYSKGGNASGAFLLTHLPSDLKVFFGAIGNIFGGQVIDVYGAHVPGSPNLGSGGTIALGVVVFVIAAVTLVVYVRRDESSAGPVGVALVVFGLLFAASVTTSRAQHGAGVSRYTTFDLLILAGCYLAMLAKPRRSWIPAALAVIVGLVALQVVLGTIEGIAYARTWERHEIAIQAITGNIDKSTNVQIGAEVYPGAEYFPNFAAEVRQWVHLAETHHLSQFAP